MPRIGKNSGGRSKAAGGNAGGGIQVNLRRKSGPAKGQNTAIDPDDAPLNPGTLYEEVSEAEAQQFMPEPVEPFTDGLVSMRLRGLTVIPRAGGEEVAVLHDFLLMFAKTETFIGAISSKTSFMKKAGGRLL